MVSPPRTKTTCGAFIGSWENNTAVYRGIKYGSIARRWQPPTLVCNAAGQKFNALVQGSICWQIGRQLRGFGTKQSEDCLNLDVYVPPGASHNHSTPVVVWLHGGSLVLGSTTMFPNLAFLAAATNFIFVVPNYRVGAHGFLATDGLAAGDPRGSSGNYGLLDCVLALEWTRLVVEAFGGDHTRVSVWGQSSGATAIYALFAMPKAAGLFTSAVALSGSPNITISSAAANAQNQAMLRSLGPTSNASKCAALVAERQLDCLLSLSAAEAAMLPGSFNVGPVAPVAPTGQGCAQLLVPTYHISASALLVLHLRMALPRHHRYVGLPVVDGHTLAMSPEQALRAGLVNASLLLQNTQVSAHSHFTRVLGYSPLRVSAPRAQPLC